MSDYDSDDVVEFLIQFSSLTEVLEFVEARDEVRRIPSLVSPVTCDTVRCAEAA